MFSVKIDGHLLNSEGHKAQHYHEVKYFVLDLGLYASASRKREGYTLKNKHRLSNDS